MKGNRRPLLKTAHIVDQCPACGARQFEPVSTPGNSIGEPIFGPYLEQFGVCRCACGLEFTNPRPSTQLLDQFYGSRIYDCHRMDQSAAADRNAQALLGFIAQHGPFSASKRLLDFGCGGGYFLAHAANAGWSAKGFDVGDAAIETCRANNLTVTNQISDLEPASFDVIVLNHVFEHIEEPASLLRALRLLLMPQGKLIVVVPNVRSARARLSLPILSRKCGFDERHRAFPIHLWYFSPATLAKLLRTAGFEPVVVTTQGMGLEELMRSELPESASAVNGRAREKSRLRPVKDRIKSTFYGLGFGENVLVAARPI
jgi:SAM-dependent methyltransferase